MTAAVTAFIPLPARQTSTPIVLALLLLLVFVGVWESAWRRYGFRPGVEPGDKQWALERLNVSGYDQVVITGTSRAHRAFRPEVWESITNRRPLQLAVPGGVGQLMLAHFAADAEFRGLLILDISPGTYLRMPAQNPAVETRLAEYAAMRTSPFRRYEALLRLTLERNLVSFEPRLTVPQFFRRWSEGRESWFFIDKNYTSRLEDLEDPALFGGARRTAARTVDVLLKLTRQKSAARIGQERAAMAEELARNVRAIRARGGEVVFVHPPITGYMNDVQSQAFPRFRFWDYFQRTVPGVWIHFEDYAETADIEAIDWNHLSRSAAEEFTRAICPIILHAVQQEGRVDVQRFLAPGAPLATSAAAA